MSHKHDALILPELGAEALEVIGQAEVERWRKAKLADVAKQTGRRSCYHCGTDFETCPRETHEIIPKGMGGSAILLDPRNRIDICAVCHKRAQPSDGTTFPTLRFFRNDAGQIRSLEIVNGAWEEMTPFGAFVDAEVVSERLHEVQVFGTKLANHRTELDQWSDEALKTEFENSEQAGVVLFITQCHIVSILATRRSRVNGQKDETAGLRGAAAYLGLAYQTARTYNAIFASIIKRAPDAEWLGVSPTFFHAAYRGKERVDPLRALRYAQDKLLANPNYNRKHFEADIQRGLPAEGIDEGLPLKPQCPHDCVHCVRAPSTATIELYDGELLVARGQIGSGSGMQYCDAVHRLASAVAGTDMATCQHAKARHARGE